MKIAFIIILAVVSYVTGLAHMSHFYEMRYLKPQQKQYCKQTYKNDVSKYETCYNKDYELTFKVKGY